MGLTLAAAPRTGRAGKFVGQRSRVLRSNVLRLHRARTWSSTPTAWSQDSCSEPDGLPRHDMLLQRLHLRFVHAATCSPTCARGVQVERPTQIHASERERERAGEKRQVDEPIPQFPIPLSPRVTCMVTNVSESCFLCSSSTSSSGLWLHLKHAIAVWPDRSIEERTAGQAWPGERYIANCAALWMFCCL